MNDPLQAILQPGMLKSTAFPPTSRYHWIDTATLETADGKTIIYLRRPFVPPSERFALLWGGWQERLRHGSEQENWSYAIDLGKVLDHLNLELLE